MGLLDRECMRRDQRNGGASSGNGGGGGIPKLLMIAAIAVPLATGAWFLYQKISKEMTPGEGDLVVNVNTATQQELETIPGVGPTIARQIIAGRPYTRVEDLERVRGIGPFTINNMRPYVKFEGETQRR